MNLMQNEKVILELCSNQLVLTTHRIRYQVEVYGNVELTSIMLDKVASCSLRRRNQPLLILAASVLTLIGLLIAIDIGNKYGGEIFFLIMFVIACIDTFVWLTYLQIRQPIILIASAGQSIKVKIKKMKLETALNFINSIETMKNQRYFHYNYKFYD